MTDDDIYPRLVAGYCGDSKVSVNQMRFILDRVPERGSILEIGSASGVTAAIIADARPRGLVVCVDTFNGVDVYTEPLLRYIDWRRNQRANMSLWVNDARSLVRSLSPGSRFDVVFVDADHSFKCTLEGIELGTELVKPGGSIIVHDWRDPGWPHVAPAVDRFLREHPSWRLAAGSDRICALEDGEGRT